MTSNQIPLDQWDIKPGSYIRFKNTNEWRAIEGVTKKGILHSQGASVNFNALAKLFQISEDGLVWKLAYKYVSQQ